MRQTSDASECWYEHYWGPWRALFYTDNEAWEARKRMERYRECQRCGHTQFRALEHSREAA